MTDTHSLTVPARPMRAIVLILCLLPAFGLGLALIWTIPEVIFRDTGAGVAVALLGLALVGSSGLGLLAALPDLTTRGTIMHVDDQGIALPRIAPEVLRWDTTDWEIRRHRLLLMRVIALHTRQPIRPRGPERLIMALNPLFGVPRLTLSVPGLRVDQLSMILSHYKAPVSASGGTMAGPP